jgi:HEAT repeat protein
LLLVAAALLLGGVLAFSWSVIRDARISLLVTALEEGSEAEHAQALEHLGALRSPGEVRVVIARLDDCEGAPDLALRFGKAFSAMGDAAVEPLVSEIRRCERKYHSTPSTIDKWIEARARFLVPGRKDDVRLVALENCIPDMDAVGRKVVVRLFSDHSTDVRAYAGDILSTGPPGMLDLCVMALGSADAWLRYRAAQGLDRTYFGPALQPLLAATRDESTDVRCASCCALRLYTGEAAVVETLIATFESGEENTAVRRDAIASLYSVKDPRVLDVSLAALGTRDLTLTEAATGAIDHCEDARRDGKLRALLCSADSEDRRRAAEYFLASHLDAKVTMLTEAYAAANAAARPGILRTLRMLGPYGPARTEPMEVYGTADIGRQVEEFLSTIEGAGAPRETP